MFMTIITELFDIFKWYIAIQILGIAGFILGYKLFIPLKHRGFCISKISGMFLFSTLAWFICNKKLAILPYSSFSLYLILLIIGGFTYYTFKQNKEEITNYLKNNKKYLIYLEIGFLISFLLLVLLRTYTPNIEGTEKPLEFVVFNSILRADYMPPEDVWVSGHLLNYYYLGQFIFSCIIKLTFINPSVAFNLIAPTVLSLVLIATFGFIYELTKSTWWGLLATFMTGLMGNLEPIWQIAQNGWVAGRFRWWEAGHIIPHSFPEFPYWSYLHADVHAHLLVHPFTILFLFLILTFIRSGHFLITIEDFKNGKKLALNTLYCLLLGSFMIINSWNYPSAIALTFAALYIHSFKNLPKTSLIKNIIRVFPPGLFYILYSYGLYLAFYAFYSSPVNGLGFVNPAHRTTTLQFILLLGVFLIPICIFIIYNLITGLILNKNIKIKNRIYLTVALIILLAGSFFLYKSFVITISFAIWLYLLSVLLLRKSSTEEMTIYSIMFLAFSLILTCEFIFVNDLFSSDYERQNTVAKSYIQILLLLPIATAYIMSMISSQKYLKNKTRSIYIVSMSLLIILASIFLWVGTYIKNNKFERVYEEQNWHIPTLNGSKYLATKYDGEYDAIMWLRKHNKGKNVVLEMEGRPYSHYGRVASHSGMPSLVNWVSSLGVLRGGNFYHISNPRQDAISEIYKTKNKKEIIPLLHKFGITYIYIGPLERMNYSKKQLEGFSTEKELFKNVFSKGNTTIYKVK